MPSHRTLPSAASVPSTSSATDVTPELRQVHVLQAKINQLRTRDAEITVRIQRDLRERDEVRGVLAETEAELETAAMAPLAGGIDPTAWLPDEILWMILVRVLVRGTCGWVCRRWHAVCAGATAKKQAWQWQWAGYAHGEVPDVWPVTGQGTTCAPATCLTRSSLDRSLYFGLEDGNIIRWSLPGKPNFVKGHSDCVNAIFAGKDGTVYSASDDRTILVWSANGGSHLQTLEGHTSAVVCLALGVDGTLYSGSSDKTVRVWAGRDGPLRLIRTLEGHTSAVRSLALGTDGKLCSGSCDHTIRVWSTTDGSHLETLTRHTGEVMAVAVAADGTLFSGSYDGTIRMWSGLCNSAKRTVQVLRTNSPVWAIAIGVGNTVFFGDDKHRVGVWNAGSVSSRMRIIYTLTSDVRAMAIDHRGLLSVVCDDDSNVYDL